MCACVYRGGKEARVLCEKPMGELTSNNTNKTSHAIELEQREIRSK